MKSNKKIWIAAVLTASILLLLFLWLTPKYFLSGVAPETLTSLPDEIKNADNTPRTLTIEEVYALSQKETISWADLSAYSHSQDFGSGISIHLFPIEEHFYLMVGGVHSDKENSDEPLFYVRLCYQSEDDSSADNEEIDILTGDVKEFYESHKK